MLSLMSSCPHLDVRIGEVLAPCLVDTGSMVSTIVESFFLKHFAPLGQDRRRSCQWLQLRAANELAIPYVDYIELDAELCGQAVSNWDPGRKGLPRRPVLQGCWCARNECP